MTMNIMLYQGNGRLKVYDIEAKCFESDIKITESRSGRSVRLVRGRQRPACAQY